MFIKKLSEKHIAVLTLIFLITFFIVLSIWYCNKDTTEEKQVAAKNVKEIKTISEINIGIYEEKSFKNINPIETQVDIVTMLSKLVYNGLFEYNEDTILNEKLVSNYAKIGEKNYIFKLKENIYFQNGQPLTSADVKNTIEKIYSSNYSIYSELVNNIQNVKVIDNKTFRINLIENEEEFERNLIFPIICDEVNMGTGIYKVKEINTDKIILEEFSGKTGQIINIYVYDILTNLYEDFKNKKLDLIKSVSGIEYKKYLGEFGYKEKFYNGNEYIYLEFNSNEYNFFRDSKLKEAVISSINENEIITKVFNGNAVKVKRIEYDLDNAVNILENQHYIYKNNGWYNKEKFLKIIILLNKKELLNLEIAYIIKGQLEKVGINVELDIVDEEEYNDKVKRGKYDILISNIKKEFINEKNNYLFCNRLSLLYSPNLLGKITPRSHNIFYNINTWKKIVK